MRKYLSISLILLGLQSIAQMRDYGYSQEILNPTIGWQRIELPSTLFQYLNANTSDIRILGITANNDTIEAPYFIEEKAPTTQAIQLDFTQLNSSSKEGVYYTTFKLDKLIPINKISLNIMTDNFDYRVKLEGSTNNAAWFTIRQDYRIVGLNTNTQNWSYTDLQFPKSVYTYYRVSIAAENNPNITAASIDWQYKNEVPMLNFPNQYQVNEETKISETYQLELKEKVPVSSFTLKTSSSIDFVRPIEIKALTDSFETEKGMRYTYSEVYRGMFSSLKENKFNISPTLAKSFRINITNYNDAPISIDQIEVAGHPCYITTRLDKQAKYYLVYGNKNVSSPRYDLALIKEQRPKDAPFVDLGTVTKHHVDEVIIPEKDRSWILWSVMAVAIVLLGGFTLKMMKTTESSVD
jgi:hypothetical protein